MPRVPHVVSYPKSGRTWLRVMLDDLGVEAAYTHDGAGYEDGASLATLHADKTRYAFTPVLLMVRDPRDVVVSGYFQVTRRLRLQSAASISMSEFIRNAYYGIEKTARFNLHWFAAAHARPDVAILSYEDLHRNTELTLSAAARFAGHDIPAQTIGNVAARRSFAEMRKLEAAGAFSSRYGDALTPADPADAESYKVRRGIIGGHVDYLSRDDLGYCEGILGATRYFAELEAALALRSVLAHADDSRSRRAAVLLP